MSIPINPIFLFSDSQLLFWSNEQGEPVLGSVRDIMEKESPKAAYIGASNGDDPMFFSIFEAAMDQINIKDRRMIYANYDKEDRDYLLEADLILLAGGDVAKGWKAIHTTEMQQDLIQRYYAGTVLVGISAGAVQLGLGGWHVEDGTKASLFDTFKLIPFYVDCHDEDQSWTRLKRIVKEAETPVRGMGIPKGGGLVYHPDHTLEPIRQSLVEFSLEGEEVVQNLLLPPHSGQGEESEG